MTSPATNPPAASEPGRPVPPDEEQSVGQLVTSALDDVSRLVRHEIDLVKAELTFSVKNGGAAAGLFATAAFVLVVSFVMLSMAFAYLIHLTGLDLAYCFLIVWFVYTLVAAILGFVGYKRVQYVGPPTRAIEQAKETKETLLRRGTS
jgi:putative superfamily III holin-X